MNKNNDKFVEERTVLLQRFFKEIGKYEYIISSPEFKIFSRGQGDIEKLLAALPKQTPGQILEKYRNSFKIDEEQDAAAMETYKDRILNFQQYLKKAIQIMEMQKKQLKVMVDVRTKQDKS